MGKRLELVSYDHGKDGFQQAVAVCVGDLVLGRIDFGGESQRGWVRTNLTGRACEWIEGQGSWDAAEALQELPGAEIRRVDLALTTWDGEVKHELVESAYASGLFCSGGRPPELQTITGSNPRAGRTCYVGKRTADKFFRGYEKGFELAGKLGALGGTITHIDGHPIEDIYRCETEFKAEGRVVPWEVIGKRDQYFAGSYPFLAQLLPDVETDIMMRRPEREPQMLLSAALANCRQQYGATLFTALMAYHGDIGRVWEQVLGDHHNEHLLAAGVMLVDHE